MPLSKVHVLEGRYDQVRLAGLSEAVQNALIEVLDIPPRKRPAWGRPRQKPICGR